MANMAEKESTNKKYVARHFVPKAHYKIFDWENYTPVVEEKPKVIKVKPEKNQTEKTVKKSKTKKSNDSTFIVKKSESLAGEFVAVRKIPAATKKLPVQNEVKQEDLLQNSSINNVSEAKVITKVKAFHSIGAKLIAIISALVLISLAGITTVVSVLVSKDTSVNAEANNLTINLRTTTDTENRLSSVEENIGILLELLSQNEGSVVQQNQNAQMFFDRNKAIIGVALPDTDRIFVNNQFLISHEQDESIVSDYVNGEQEIFEKAKTGTKLLNNATSVFETPVISICYPLYANSTDSVIMILYSAEDLYDSYAAGAINESYLVNATGDVLIHPDIDVMMTDFDYSKNPVVTTLMESKMPNQQMTYVLGEDLYYAAYNKLTDGSGAVVTVVKQAVVLEGVRRTTIRNIYLSVAILSVAIMLVYFFSKSLSNPLKALTKVANEINKGNFNTDAFDELNENRKDEVGVLIQSTKNERQILNTFTRMTNRGVTEAIITKQIDFDPHLKDITIFFSDIRGFTAISDGFKNRFEENSAGEIIGFLNDYMARMVNCITITGGNVDKFEGDAIMACWGVLRDDSLAFETMPDSNPEKTRLKKIHDSHVTEDAVNAIRATVAMRYSLAVYNKDAAAFTEAHKNEALAKYKPHIRIGSGLNTGRATVGFMGSKDKMEFTSIGDAVNLASRTESSNKPCGTDILITEDTYNLLKTNYIRCEENNFTIAEEYLKDEVIVEVIPVTFEVKGKGKQHFYGVVNMPNFDIEGFFRKTDPEFTVDADCAKVIGKNGPKSLHEVRTLLGIPEPDFGGVNLDEEENKIQIQTS